MNTKKKVRVATRMGDNPWRRNKPSREDRAYLAGVFDGEGHVSLSFCKPQREGWNHHYGLNVGITNTYSPLIEMLKREYGRCVGETGVKGGHRLNAYRWRLTGPGAANFLSMIVPFLTIKRRQAIIAIKFQSRLDLHKRGWVCVGGRMRFGPTSAKERKLREGLYKELIRARLVGTSGS